MSKYPSKKKQGDDLVPVPLGTKMVSYRYRGEVRKIPDFLHPALSDFDDLEDSALEIFLFSGKLPRKRVEFEQRYAP